MLTPRLSSLWVGLVTPVPARLARPLVDSLVTAVVVTDDRAVRLFPFERVPLGEAINLAIGRTAIGRRPHAVRRRVVTGVGRGRDRSRLDRWHRAHRRPHGRGRRRSAPHLARGVSRRRRTRLVQRRVALADPRLDGPAWSAGPGCGTVRRDPERLPVGDPLDFWRVEDVERDQRVVLHAEMRLPGEAWLEWELTPTATGTRLVQTARYRPRGLCGPRLLVRGGAVPPPHLPGSAARDRGGRGRDPRAGRDADAGIAG